MSPPTVDIHTQLQSVLPTTLTLLEGFALAAVDCIMTALLLITVNDTCHLLQNGLHLPSPLPTSSSVTNFIPFWCYIH